jgi:transposase InsO family protein
VAWKDVKVNEQRLQFVLRASSGKEEMAGLCREFEISRVTGYHWLKRFRETGRIEELKEKSRRPHLSPKQTCSEIEQRVVEERKRRPDWGARKIRCLLARDGIALPTCTVHRIIQRNQLIPPHHQHRPALKRFERSQPNELWQMDYKGLPSNLSQGWMPLSVLDDCSRYGLGLEALRSTQAKPVRESLVRIFQEDGLPDGMLIDHGTPWWNVSHPCGWTQLSIWMMNQGIQLHFCAVRHPQTQGKVERFHRSLEDALHERGFPPSQAQWPAWLSAFLHEYNHVRPHEALGMATPASRWKPSSRAYQSEPSPWEYDSTAPVLRVRSSGQIQFAHHAYTVSGALSGQYVQVQPLGDDRHLVYYRRTCVRELNVQKQQSYAVYFSREQRIFPDD